MGSGKKKKIRYVKHGGGTWSYSDGGKWFPSEEGKIDEELKVGDRVQITHKPDESWWVSSMDKTVDEVGTVVAVHPNLEGRGYPSDRGIDVRLDNGVTWIYSEECLKRVTDDDETKADAKVKKFSTGDRVRVPKKIDAFWWRGSGMDCTVGEIGTVTAPFSLRDGYDGEQFYSVHFDEHGLWCYPASAIELANSPVPEVSVSIQTEGGVVLRSSVQILVGDKVRVVKKHANGGLMWVSAMDKAIGKEGEVIAVSSDGKVARVSVDGEKHWYCMESLARLTGRQTDFRIHIESDEEPPVVKLDIVEVNVV